MIAQRIILFFVSLVSSFYAYCQFPANGCGFGASQQWPVNSTCTYSTFNVTGFTNAWNHPGFFSSPSCGGQNVQDGWCWFIATANSTMISYDVTSNNDDPMIHVFNAGPGGVLGCPVAGATPATACQNLLGNNGTETLTMTTIIGNWYLVRIQEIGGSNMNGQLCVSSLIAGDTPCTASNLPVSPTGSCNFGAVSNVGATTTPGIPAPGCGTYVGGDVWLTVTVPASGNIIIDGDPATLLNIAMAAYTAPSCAGPFTLVECDNHDSGNDSGMPLLALTGQTLGSTLYIMMWDNGNNQFGDYLLCATDNTAPANDEPCNATVLPVGASCTFTSSNLNYATNSSDYSTIPLNTCGDGTGHEQDIWFTATIPPIGTIEFNTDNIAGSFSNSMLEIYTGPDCNNLTSAGCFDDGSPYGVQMSIGYVSGTPGDQVWFRVWEKWGDGQGAGNVDVCAVEQYPCGANPIFLNDFCANPATLTWNPNAQFAASTAASFTPDDPANFDANNFTCGTIQNNSWYSFVAGANGTNPAVDTFAITTIANCDNPANGIQAHVYEIAYDPAGCCMAFTNVSNCLGNQTTTPAYVITTGLVPGNTYVLMIDGYAGNNCDFIISGWSAQGILPVELIEFSAIALPDRNTLTWKTASELNNDYFNILRSYDGQIFEKIGEIDGAGTSLQVQSYYFDDTDVRTGICYYQLEQVDFDGTKTLSDVITLDRKVSGEGLIRVYPNPTSDSFTAELNVTNANGGNVALLGVNGQIIEERCINTPGFYKLNFDFDRTDSGLYFIQFVDENSSSQLKIVKN